MQKPLVFISHSSRDKPFATRLAEALRERGIEIWIDHEQIRYGESVPGKIADGLKRCDALLVLVSGSFETSSWCRSEYEPILTREINDGRVRVIPLRLDDTPLPELLTHKRWVDLRTGLETVAIDELARDVKSLAHRPEVPVEPVTPLPDSSAAKSASGKVEARGGRKPSESEQPSSRTAPSPEKEAFPSGGKVASAMRSTKLWARMALPIIVLLVVTSIGLWWMLEEEAPTVSQTPEAIFSPVTLQRSKVPLPRPSVAVMTYENRSGDRDLDWLSPALAEVVSAKLGVVGDIRAVDRHHVVLAETDLRLRPQAKISPRDVERISGLLGVEFVLGGSYERERGNSPIRLDLILYDSRDGRAVARTRGVGEVTNWFDLADRSTGDLPGLSLRQELERPPLTLSQKRRLRSVFPLNPWAAKFYIQGLERYRHFDVIGASGFFDRSAQIEPHPLVLAALADTHSFLGRSQEARKALQKAKQREMEIRDTSRALPERYREEVDIVERKIASDAEGIAERSRAIFQEYFADDLSYGILAATSLVNAGSDSLAQPLLKELRRLPLARNHPGIGIATANALFVKQRYWIARVVATRAIESAKDLGAVRQEALARLQLASILSLMGDRAETKEQFRQARELFEQTGDRRGVAQCKELLALFYEGLDPSMAERLYREAIAQFQALGDQKEKGRALFGLSAVLTETGRGGSSEAEEISREAARLSSPLESGMTPFLAGYQAFLAGQLTRAQGQYEAAKKIFDLTNQRDNSAIVLTNIGEVELMRGRLTNAKDLHSQALIIHQKESEVAAFDMVCKGRVYALLGEFSSARKWYDLALQTLQAEGGAGEESKAWSEAILAIAELELLSGRADRSEERIHEVLDQAGTELDAVKSRALSLQARRLLGEHKTDAAWKVANDAKRFAPGDFRAEREAEIVMARVLADRGEVSSALKDLDRIALESVTWGQVVYEFESILAAGEIELAAGQLGAGRRRLEELRKSAERLHFGQIVKRVDSALGE